MSLLSENEIHLLKDNDKEALTDLERIQRFFDHLTDDVKLSKKKAFSIIYYLQEHLSVFPDHIEKCCICGNLFDSYRNGFHSEVNEKNYCYMCSDQMPEENN